jgi:hypothetical protein
MQALFPNLSGSNSRDKIRWMDRRTLISTRLCLPGLHGAFAFSCGRNSHKEGEVIAAEIGVSGERLDSFASRSPGGYRGSPS